MICVAYFSPSSPVRNVVADVRNEQSIHQIYASAGMLGRSLASPFLTFDTAARTSCVTPDLVTAAPIAAASLNVNSLALPSNVTRGYCTSHFSRKKWVIRSTTQVDNTTWSNEDRKTWEACREALSAFNFNAEEKDKILGKAFGNVHSPLLGLGLSDDDLFKLLKKFPEVLGCSLEHDLKTNVKILEKDWGIKGKSLQKLLLRNPKALGYNVDCKGDCIAQCTRCWARF
ncbi:CGI-12 PROTEIN-RELATED [Salix purpurea]|uniref:CGI-12 PROTEIN-RELATED n=1 Tax=Salix purpurea TaxID=77065 RepID=A0A9Q0WC71_SALPP|nr:CGI-12 PROTEIN-RELATED [Salix purpurea]